MKLRTKMRAWLICSVLGILTGCATAPTPSLWEIEPASTEIQQPLRLPQLPAPVSSTEETVTFSKEGFKTLRDYAEISEGNYQIGQANAAALEAQAKGFNALIEAGQMEERLSLLREKLLKEERRAHFIDNWFHRGIIILGAAAVAF